MKYIILSVIPALLGATIMVNGVTLKADEILDNTQKVVNQANIHQVATVLELYYSDHDEYPDVLDSEDLFNLLSEERYIRSQPNNPSEFNYTRISSGQDYILSVD